MKTFWRIAVSTSGLAAVGGFIFLSLGHAWLGLDVFCPLTADQTFILLFAFLVIVFLALLALLITFAITRKAAPPGKRGG